MEERKLNEKMVSATKWSSITEILAKLIVPLSNILLARILAPEAFGIITTITLIITFAEMFTDAGFQKYLIQQSFKDKAELYKYANVAFWTNFGIALIFWISIAFFSDNLANLLGSPGMGNVITIASLQLFLTVFSSIQIALYRRDFNFKALFLVRMVAVSVPFLITLPLALLGLNYWSLVIGTIVTQLSNAIFLTLKSDWKPKLFFDFSLLKRMFSFSIWSLVEAVSIWLTVWIDSLIIGYILNQYYLGLYKTSMTLVNSLMAIVTAATVPVLFSALSRLKDNHEQFSNLFFNSQRLISIIILPLGVGVFIYSELVTDLLLGSQWKEAAPIIGTWSLTSAITIVFAHYCSEVYRSKGMPRLSFLAQILHLIVLIPTIVISSKYGFWALVFFRSWIRLQAIVVHFILMKKYIGISVIKTLKNISPILLASTLMGVFGYTLNLVSQNLIWTLFSIILCIILYFTIVWCMPSIRQDVIKIIHNLKRK